MTELLRLLHAELQAFLWGSRNPSTGGTTIAAQAQSENM